MSSNFFFLHPLSGLYPVRVVVNKHSTVEEVEVLDVLYAVNAKWYQPETLIGKNVVIIANLAPRKIRGIMSQGMILSAEDGDDLSVLTTLGDVSGGSKVC